MTTVTVMWFYYYFVFKILSAGSEPNLFHWQLNGDPKAQVPCTPKSVFTIQVNSKSPKNKVTWSTDNVFGANYCGNLNYSENTASPLSSQFSLLAALEDETNLSYSLFCITSTIVTDCEAYFDLSGLTLKVRCQCKHFTVQKCHSLSTVSVHPHSFSLHWLHCDVWNIW